MKTSATSPTPRLRILVLSAKGSGTGSALRAVYVADALRLRGHDVSLAPLLPTWPLWLDMALSTFWYFAFSLTRRFDAVWCVKPYPSLIPACLVQKCLGAKIVFDVDDLDWAYSGGVFRSIHRLLQTPWPRLGSFTTYHNPKLKDVLVREFGLSPADLVRLPQGVDPVLFHPPATPKRKVGEAQEPWFQTHHPMLVYTAHLNVACDLSELLLSFRIFLARHPQAGLVVAGGGPDQDRFEQETRDLGLSDHVRITGLLSPQKVADYLRSSDAVLVYYRDTEANRHRASLKGREALSCGCRVVATKVGDYAEWASWAVLSKPNPVAFALAIERALKIRAKVKPAPSSWHWRNCVADLEKRLLSI